MSPAISDLFIFLLFCAIRRTKFMTRTSPHPSRMICHPQRGEAQNLDYIGHGTRLSVITFSVRHIFLYAAKQLSPQLRLWQWKAALTQSEYHPSAGEGGGAAYLLRWHIQISQIKVVFLYNNKFNLLFYYLILHCAMRCTFVQNIELPQCSCPTDLCISLL